MALSSVPDDDQGRQCRARRGASPPAPCALAALPLPLVTSIFAFAVDDVAALAPVSRAWLALAQDIASADALRVFAIHHVKASKSEVLALRRQLTLRRAFLRELTIDASGADAPYAGDWWRMVLATATTVETLIVNAKSKLADEGAIERIALLVEAASRLCPRVRTLTLPAALWDRRRPETLVAADAVLVAVRRALVQWKQGGGGGLRALRMAMPFARTSDPATKATDYVETLAASCPQLETLGVHSPVLGRAGRMAVDELWYIPLETWARFCEACVALTAFHWIHVPLAAAFVDAFSRARKPKLTRLTLKPASNWNWETYYRSQPSSAPRGIASPQVLLTACPSLRDLRIFVGVESGIDMELFGDAFCEALAGACPALERFELDARSHRRERPARGGTIASFTDTALSALAAMPLLSHVNIRSANVSAEGLLAFLTTSRALWHGGPRCNFTIAVGASADTPDEIPFYGVLLQLLERLVVWEAAREASRPSVWDRLAFLCVANGKDEQVKDGDWFARYVNTVRLQLAMLLLQYEQQPDRHADHLCARIKATPYSFYAISDSIRTVEFRTKTTPLPRNAYWDAARYQCQVDVVGPKDVSSDEEEDDEEDDENVNEDKEEETTFSIGESEGNEEDSSSSDEEEEPMDRDATTRNNHALVYGTGGLL